MTTYLTSFDVLNSYTIIMASGQNSKLSIDRSLPNGSNVNPPVVKGVEDKYAKLFYGVRTRIYTYRSNSCSGRVSWIK